MGISIERMEVVALKVEQVHVTAVSVPLRLRLPIATQPYPHTCLHAN